jgi:HKD family nuclease
MFNLLRSKNSSLDYVFLKNFRYIFCRSLMVSVFMQSNNFVSNALKKNFG